MIKLIRLVPKHIREAIDQPPPPIVRSIEHPGMSVSHAYNKPAGVKAGKQYFKGNVKNDRASVIPAAMKIIAMFENNKNIKRGGFDKQLNKWLPHDSVEGGSKTIAYGHKIQSEENFDGGLTDDEAIKLLRKDTEKAYDNILKKVPNFETLPAHIQIAALNGMFRGDLGKKTMELLAKNQFGHAAKEYLNYKGKLQPGARKRMEWNAREFQRAA